MLKRSRGSVSSGRGLRNHCRHVIIADPAPVRWIVPEIAFVGGIRRRAFKPPAIDVDNVTTLARIVGQRPPRQRMVPVANSQESAKTHDGILGFTGYLI